MILVVPGEEPAKAWLVERGYRFVPPFTTLACVDDRIRAVFVYNDYTESNIELSPVSDGPLPFTRGVFRAMFHYPFNQLGVDHLTVRTRKKNRDVRRLIRRLGFKPEGQLKRYYGDDDAMIYGMNPEDCRWLR